MLDAKKDMNPESGAPLDVMMRELEDLWYSIENAIDPMTRESLVMQKRECDLWAAYVAAEESGAARV